MVKGRDIHQANDRSKRTWE